MIMRSLCLAIAVALFLPSTGIAKTACQPKAMQIHDADRWGYRDLEGRKCWFRLTRIERRGEHRDINELFWEPPAPLPVSESTPPWALEGRWQVRND